MVDIIVYVFRHTDGRQAIVECAIEAGNDYDHSLCVLDVDETSALLEGLTVCALGVSRSHSFMHTKSVRVQRLNRAACLVAEVERALVLPLWGAFDTAIEAESFSVLRDYPKTAQTSISCHNYLSSGPRSQPGPSSEGSSSWRPSSARRSSRVGFSSSGSSFGFIINVSYELQRTFSPRANQLCFP